MDGSRVLTLNIADVVIGIELPGASWREPMLERFGLFMVDATPEQWIRVQLVPEPGDRPGGDPRIDEEADGLHLRHDEFDAHWDFKMQTATLRIFQVTSDPVDHTYVMVLDSFLRIVMSLLLVATDGLILHAAGIATDAQAGYVFFGPSGSGKTTMCSLSHPRYDILCDELIILRPDANGHYRLYGTPFYGAWGRSMAQDAPLTEVLCLTQSKGTRKAPMTPVEKIQALLACVVFYRTDPLAAATILDSVHRLIDTATVTRLEFEAKETVWDTILT